MHLTLATIGKAKSNSPTSQLFATYVKRLPWNITLKELEVKKALPTEQLKAAEAKLLLDACAGADKIIALDETGKTLSSPEFASKIGDWQGEEANKFAFIIGGSDGLDASIRAKADLTISFGRLTWPHMLVRPMLAEQLYRAYTILTHHPYHRE